MSTLKITLNQLQQWLSFVESANFYVFLTQLINHPEDSTSWLSIAHRQASRALTIAIPNIDQAIETTISQTLLPSYHHYQHTVAFFTCPPTEHGLFTEDQVLGIDIKPQYLNKGIPDYSPIQRIRIYYNSKALSVELDHISKLGRTYTALYYHKHSSGVISTELVFQKERSRWPTVVARNFIDEPESTKVKTTKKAFNTSQSDDTARYLFKNGWVVELTPEDLDAIDAEFHRPPLLLNLSVA